MSLTLVTSLFLILHHSHFHGAPMQVFVQQSKPWKHQDDKSLKEKQPQCSPQSFAKPSWKIQDYHNSAANKWHLSLSGAISNKVRAQTSASPLLTRIQEGRWHDNKQNSHGLLLFMERKWSQIEYIFEWLETPLPI